MPPRHVLLISAIPDQCIDLQSQLLEAGFSLELLTDELAVRDRLSGPRWIVLHGPQSHWGDAISTIRELQRDVRIAVCAGVERGAGLNGVSPDAIFTLPGAEGALVGWMLQEPLPQPEAFLTGA